MRRSRRHGPRIGNVAVAMIAIAVIAAASYMAFTKSVPFIHGYRVQAVFSSSNQLIKGSPVRIAGVNVGTVRELAPGPGRTMLVTMEIKDAGRPVHRDARAKIRPRLFLEGGFYIDLKPGSAGSPELEENEAIPLPQTAIPVQFHQLLLALNRPTRQSLRETIDEVAAGFEEKGAKGLNQTLRELAPVLRDTALLTEAALGRNEGDLSGLIDGSATTAAALASVDTQLASLVTGLKRTTTALASQDLALAGTIREADRLLRAAPGAIRTLDAALPPVNQFAVDLRPALQVAPPVLTKAVAALTQLNAIAGPDELPALLNILGPSVKTLPQLTRRLNMLFPLVTPVTDCVLMRVGPVLLAKLEDPPHTSGQLVWQEMLHAFGNLASASQNYDANGPSIRFLLGGGDSLVQLNDIPNLGQLFAQTSSSNPIIGARPVWLGSGVKPPFRPDVSCKDQAFPDLTARGSLAAPRTNYATGRRAPALPRTKVTGDQLKSLVAGFGTTGSSGTTGASGAEGAR